MSRHRPRKLFTIHGILLVRLLPQRGNLERALELIEQAAESEPENAMVGAEAPLKKTRKMRLGVGWGVASGRPVVVGCGFSCICCPCGLSLAFVVVFPEMSQITGARLLGLEAAALEVDFGPGLCGFWALVYCVYTPLHKAFFAEALREYETGGCSGFGEPLYFRVRQARCRAPD